MLAFIVNKLGVTNSRISPGLIIKVDSIYISVPWFRFTLMDPALRVLFHRFQTIFDRIRLTFSVAAGTKSTNYHKCNQIQLFPRLTSRSLGDCNREHIKQTREQSPEFDKKAHQTRREGQTEQGSTPGREANLKLDSW